LLSQFCQKKLAKSAQKLSQLFFATMSKKGQPNAEKTGKRDKKSQKKYRRVFRIPRPDATKSYLVIRIDGQRNYEITGPRLYNTLTVGSKFNIIL
jgi:hypothetical protein